MSSSFFLCSGILTLGVLEIVERVGLGLYSLQHVKRRAIMRTLYHVNFNVCLSKWNESGQLEPCCPRRGRRTCLVRLVPNQGHAAAKLLIFGTTLTTLHPMDMQQVRHGDCTAIFMSSAHERYHMQFRDVYRLLVFLSLLDAICYGVCMSSYLDYDSGYTDDEDEEWQQDGSAMRDSVNYHGE